MKKKLLILVMLSVLFSGCEKEEADEPITEISSSPIINIISPSDSILVHTGEPTALSFEVKSADIVITNISVFQKYEDGASVEVFEESMAVHEYNRYLNITVNDNEGYEIWTISATNAHGEISIKTVTVKILDLSPSIMFKCGDGYICEDSCVLPSTIYSFGIIASSSIIDKSKVKVFRQLYDGSLETLLDTAVNYLDKTWTLTAPNVTEATNKIFCSITNMNGQFFNQYEFSIITNEAIPNDLNTYSDIFLVSYELEYDCFFSSSTGETFTAQDCIDYPDNQNLVDIAYFHLGPNNENHTFMSPSLCAGVGYPEQLMLQYWSNGNETKFTNEIYINIPWNELETVSQLNDITENLDIDYCYIDDVDINAIYAFKTITGKRGLIKIIHRQSAENPGLSSLIIDVKI